MSKKNLKLTWEWVKWYGNSSMGNAWRSKVGRGFLWLHPWDTSTGITYTSNFGANSDKSFTGFLPGLTIDEAKESVYENARKYWDNDFTNEERKESQKSLEDYNRYMEKRR